MTRLDPIVSLAVAIAESPGLSAFLLGSGGIVSVFMKPEFDAQLKRWQHHCPVRVKIMIKDIDRVPDLDVLNAPGKRDFRKTVMQMDKAVLEDAEYERALAAIEAAYDETKGDIRDPHFNRVR